MEVLWWAFLAEKLGLRRTAVGIALHSEGEPHSRIDFAGMVSGLVDIGGRCNQDRSWTAVGIRCTSWAAFVEDKEVDRDNCCMQTVMAADALLRLEDSGNEWVIQTMRPPC